MMRAFAFEVLRVKALLLLTYLLFLFLLARIQSLVTWHFDNQWPQPPLSSLTVAALTELLEERMIDSSKSNAVEKSDLVQLVKDSGTSRTFYGTDSLSFSQLTQDELESIHGQSTPDKTVIFTGSSDYYQQVEKSRDSAWLVLMLVNSSSSSTDNNWKSPLTSKTWTAIVKSASKRGIRVGVLRCNVGKQLCKSRKVVSSRLLLTLPQPDSKESFISVYTETFSLRYVYRWLLGELRINIRRIDKPRLLHDHWLTFRSPLQQPETHVVLVTGRTVPEPFFTAVAARFPDLANFAWLNIGNNRDTAKELEKWVKDVPGADPSSLLPMPAILVANSEGVYVYGQKSRRFGAECFTDQCLANFLIHLRPTRNGGLSASFITVGFLAILEFFFKDADCEEKTKRMIVSGLLYFVVISFLWCGLSSDDALGFVGLLNTLTLRFTRYLSLTSTGALIRHDVLLYTSSLSGFILLGLSVIPAFILMNKLACKMTRETRKIDSYISNINSGRLWYHSTYEHPDLRQGARNSQTSQDNSSGRERERTSRSRRRDGSSESSSSDSEDNNIHNRQQIHLTEEGMQALLRHMELFLAELATEVPQPRLQDAADQLPEWSYGREEPPEVLMGFDCKLCVICREEFGEGDSMTGLPCRHVFHRACVVRWLNSGVFTTCPLCRS